MRSSTARRFVAVMTPVILSLSACTSFSDPSESSDPGVSMPNDGCTPVIAAVSSEKVNLFTDLAARFKQSSEAKALDKCATIVPVNVASGEAARLLKSGWLVQNTTTPRPVIWSPASTNWVDQVTDAQGPNLAPDPVSFARTPVVFAMPRPMADALGWPNKQIGFKQLRQLCLSPSGWAGAGGSSTWGGFKLGKTNPNTSTTGLNTLLMQAYAASGKTKGLTERDVNGSEQFSRQFESCVIHYGDTTGSVLQRLYDRGLEGQPLNYVSAVAVEETSVINYNRGNPTSRVVPTNEKLKPPSEPLVAVYPAEGSIESNNPLVVLGDKADWVSGTQRTAAQAFRDFVLTEEAQKVLGSFGFRPADRKIAPSGLISTKYGVDPSKPRTVLPNPSVTVSSAAVRAWEQIRKPSSVLVLLDVSNSMSEPATDKTSRIKEATKAAVQTLDHFRPTDELGMWSFSTGLGNNGNEIINVVRDVKPLYGDSESLGKKILQEQPVGGTPLYDAVSAAQKYMAKRAQPGRINGIIVLSDGEDRDSSLRIEDLTRQLRGSAEGNNPAQVRVFPIIYSQDAPPAALRKMAEASGGQVFDASDPRRLAAVLQSVVNNF